MTTPATDRKDPFDQLVDACNEALRFVVEREERATTEAAKRGEQRARIEEAVAALNGQQKAKRKGSAWTPERRAAQAERMKARAEASQRVRELVTA